jgi:hypothetical protein
MHKSRLAAAKTHFCQQMIKFSKNAARRPPVKLFPAVTRLGGARRPSGATAALLPTRTRRKGTSA